MGQKNRQRRAAQNDQRAQQRARNPRVGFVSDVDQEALAADAAAGLLANVLQHLIRGQPAFDLADFRRCPQRHQQAAVDGQVALAVDRVIEAGWTPLDLHEVVRRKAAGSASTHLLDVVAAVTAQHPTSLVHPQWQAQLDGLGARVRRTGGLSPSFDWVDRSGQDWASALEQLLSVLALVGGLPKLRPVLPAPGRRPDPAAEADGIDGRVLRRVRGLLAKAESTEHAQEAEALMAKAQELMTRYSIERALAESVQPAARVPVSRRLWPESPYVHAKALLIAAVADANNCRAIHSTGWGFVTIVGHAADLDVVELLTTSLLVQATRAMTQAGPRTTRAGTSGTRSFRQSFLIAYAERIGERLRESAHTTETTYDTGHGGDLVPVLAARREAVHHTVTALFPDLVQRRISVTHADGWHAGRAAADRARFDVHNSLAARAG